jgi:hypothetical protein
MPNIYAAISACMSEIGAIGKDQQNTQQNFKYRGVDAVMNALQPVMVKNHVFVVPQVLEQAREERTTAKGAHLLYSILKVKYTFFADDGSSIDSIVVGEGMDSADKSSNKAMAAAFKYACFQTFCIPTEETHPDPDADTPPQSQPAKSNSPTAKPKSHDTAHQVAFALIKRFGEKQASEMLFPITGYKSTKEIPDKELKRVLDLINGFEEIA